MISEEITKKYGREYLLRQLGEECGELVQASLKLIRVWNKETPVTEEKAREKLVEEMADVLLMLRYVRDDVLTSAESRKITDIMNDKAVRMYRRMILGEADAQ
jgi:NTP pyrophosphatase (non-canonical NTP hydrolase)